jgi:hypothetical protein
MKHARILSFAAGSAAVLSVALCPPAAAQNFSADFEAPAYTLGQLEGQGIWTNWTGMNNAFTQVVNSQNHTTGGSQGIEISSGADTVADFDALPGGSYDSGAWSVKAYHLCPVGGSGTFFFLMMNEWSIPAGPYEWNVQLELNSTTSLARLYTPDGVKEKPLVFGTWTEIRCDYDLNNNQVTVYYNGTPIHTYDPRCGVTVGCGGAYSGSFIDAIDLYPDPATTPTPVYIDDISVEPLGPQPVGTNFCYGDGSGTTPCPCGNPGGTGEGCANSSGSGATMDAVGTDVAANDDIVFSGHNLLPAQPALLFVGDNAINGGNGLAFGDGLRCAGLNVVRLGVMNPDANGDASWGPGLGAMGGWTAGDTRRFQVWYRDPIGSPCGTGFNLSHGLEIAFN